jgi:hypothetical protein
VVRAGVKMRDTAVAWMQIWGIAFLFTKYDTMDFID